MCEPTTIAVLMAAGAVMGAAGTMYAAKGEAEQAKAQEKLARFKAKDALERGEIEAMKTRQIGAQFKGTQQARLAANGLVLDSGSPAQILMDTAEQTEFDALTLRSNASRESYAQSLSAWAARKRARSAMVGGALSAGGTLLGGAASAGSYYNTATA